MAFVAVTLGPTAPTATADRPSLLKMFARDPGAQPIGGMLSKEAGPFMILADTVVGEGSKERAERLAAELRSELRLPTFLYNERFDFTKTVSYDPRSQRRTRYMNAYQYEAYAVLVGEYDTVDHPAIAKDLQRIKRMKPKVYDDPEAMAAETDKSKPVTMVKNLTQTFLSAARKQGKDFGPMAHAFVTRNPMLPAEFFAPPQVDSFVAQLNEDLPHSLLESNAKYTVVVKTFRGRGQIIEDENDPLVSNQLRMRRLKKQAGKMVAELRSQGVEAYQFHDRTRSLVTVGSFDRLGEELPGGKFLYSPNIEAVMNQYSALNVRPELARQVPVGTSGVAANAVAMIPFDVQPVPIAVPKKTRRGFYGARR